MIVISWEYPDGSGGAFGVEADEYALDYAISVVEQHPGARVWCGECIIERGFIAMDERDA